MSKSKGNVVPLSALLEVLPPEAVRYFYFRVDPNKHQDFDPAVKLLPLVEEYERTQGIAQGRVAPSPREDADDIKRTAALASVREDEPAPPDVVPFNHLVTLAQIARDTPEALRVLQRSGYAFHAGSPDEKRLRLRADHARRFLDLWVDPEDRFTVIEDLSKVPLDKLDGPQRQFLARLAGALGGGEWAPGAIHDFIFLAAGEVGLAPKDAFRALYLAIIGQEKGPRAGYFLSSLDRAFVIRRLQEAGTSK